jgi:hypothetical protein
MHRRNDNNARRSSRALHTIALSFAILFLVNTLPSHAHPGIGIVMDSKGNIYYTDLNHVWKLTPQGKKSIAVSNVHTHELYIDANDNLYGEHLWYEGKAIDRWGHRVWRLAADGTLADIVPARNGFREDYGDFFFVRDGRGNMYWADRGDTTAIRKRSPEGITSIVAKAKFRDVRWMTVTPEGTVYLIDLYDLVRIMPDGSIHTVATGLAGWNLSRLSGPDRHAVMGLWTDTEGNVYAAVYAERVVKRMGADGRLEVVARCDFPWSPTGGIIGPDGDLWLLEYSITNAARVRRIGKAGRSIVFD